MTLFEFGRAARVHWGLADELTFLNHGSFGAVPLELLERAATLRRELERNPVEGMWRSVIPGLRRSAARVAEFLGARPEHTGFVVNASAGVNAVLGSLALAPGDEILHLDHGYNAVWQTLRELARRRGIVPVRVPLALPVGRPEALVEAFMAAATARTKLIVLDQITSPTALVLACEPLIAAAAERGIEVLVDGAHAPGMLERPADLGALAWTGNLHKWPCALRGCAVLIVRADVAATIHPPVISHFLDEGFTREFDWQGTIDPTPWLLAGEALAFMDRFGGWPAVRARNHALATQMHAMLCERLGVEPISPLDGSWLGSMATLRLPDPLQPRAGGPTPEQVQAELLRRANIELPILDFGGARYLRISCHVYNEAAEYARLADAVLDLAAP
ncbi:aminotransferase class V-fold PLP-dependent enzyme [Nannocystaceae bacterium ST9]